MTVSPAALCHGLVRASFVSNYLLSATISKFIRHLFVTLIAVHATSYVNWYNDIYSLDDFNIVFFLIFGTLLSETFDEPWFAHNILQVETEFFGQSV